jgi:xanthine dehydrogenase accessory factor
MKEIKEIVRAFNEACKAHKKTALATVVQVEGSAYRRPGARMLVTEDGQLTGAISGGCLEGDALKKARLVMVQQKPMLVTYDTTDDDDAKLGVGLGCNGIIHILIEPIDLENKNNPLFLLSELLNQRQAGVLVTLFSLEDRKAPQFGTCLLLKEDKVKQNKELDEDLQEQILTDAQEVLSNNSSLFKTYSSAFADFNAFIELIKPAVSINIVGAGNDVIPLTEMAFILGWEINVFDGRPNLVTRQRFPCANRLIAAKAEEALDHIPVDEQHVFVLMTHNYNYDMAMLRQLLPLNIPYIGVLGPKKKLHRIIDELEKDGELILEEQLQKVYGPAGLQVGAETSEEIALSIISEIKAVLSKSNGGFLKDKKGPIHTSDQEAQKEAATI